MINGGAQATLHKREFDALAALAYRESGLKLAPEKMLMVQSRLRHRLRALTLSDFETYAEFVCSSDGFSERRYLISALTTNVSHFFRERHHFDLLQQALLPVLEDRVRSGQRIRIWSAGCSNGQEPYSIAMHLLRAEPDLAGADFRILATDIDPRVVAYAQRGIYTAQQASSLREAHIDEFTQPDPDTNGVAISEQVKACVTFRELNLLSEWPMRSQFDAIFCRNVVIYFDSATQHRLWPRFHVSLKENGMFFLGHSERIAEPASCGFRSIGPTAYTKVSKQTYMHAGEKGDIHGTS